MCMRRTWWQIKQPKTVLQDRGEGRVLQIDAERVWNTRHLPQVIITGPWTEIYSFPPFCNQKELMYSHQMYLYPRAAKKTFYVCPVKTGISAKELKQDEPFCKSIHPKRKVRRPFCECFSSFMCRLPRKKKRRGETTVARNPVRLPKQQCSLARSSLSAPLLLLVLGIRQLIPPLNTLARSP